MDDNDDTPAELLDAARHASRLPLLVAAVAFTIVGLAGPLMLAAGTDPSPYRWLIAPLWVVVIGGVLIWRRSFLRGIAAARAARRVDAMPPGKG